MSLTTQLSQEWQKFREAFEAFGYRVVCGANFLEWSVYEDGKLVFEVGRGFCWQTFEGTDNTLQTHESAVDARKAAYQWLLSQHCVIGMAVSA